MFIPGNLENISTTNFITVYWKFIQIPLGSINNEKIEPTNIKLIPVYIKKVISGDTNNDAKMPAGAKLPNNLSEIGAVKVCAAIEALKDEDIITGKNKLVIFFKLLLNSRIPNNAP